MTLQIGNPPIEVRLRRIARARRFSLRVSSLDGAVTLSMPLRARAGEAMDFLLAQEGWMRRALDKVPQGQTVAEGALFPLEGRLLRLTLAEGRGPVRPEAEALILPGGPEGLGPRLRGFLRTRARDRLVAASLRHAGALGRQVAEIALRDTRSRWGSCSANGRLMYSWRLIMAPPQVLDYVAAHEVAHLVEMNHSPAFWDVVASLCPDWPQHRAWLRREGNHLHGWRF